MVLTGIGCSGASLPDADNSGARGLGLKPEAPAWYFKRTEWLWSQLSINRCTQSGENKTWNGGKKWDDDRGQKILTDILFFSFFFSFPVRQSKDPSLGLFTHATKPYSYTHTLQLFSGQGCRLKTVFSSSLSKVPYEGAGWRSCVCVCVQGVHQCTV